MWSSLADGFSEFASVVSKDAQSVLTTVSAGISQVAAEGELSPPGSPASPWTSTDFSHDVPKPLPEALVRKLQKNPETFVVDLEDEEVERFTPAWMRPTSVEDTSHQEQVFAVAQQLLQNSSVMQEQFRSFFPEINKMQNWTLNSLQALIESKEPDDLTGFTPKLKKEGEQQKNNKSFQEEEDEENSPSLATRLAVEDEKPRRLLPSSFFVRYFIRLNKLLILFAHETQRIQQQQSREASLEKEQFEQKQKQQQQSKKSNQGQGVEEVQSLREENSQLRQKLQEAEKEISILKEALENAKKSFSASSVAHSSPSSSSSSSSPHSNSMSKDNSSGGSSTVNIATPTSNAPGSQQQQHEKKDEEEDEEQWTEIS